MRIWSNRMEDDGSVHPMGNGELLVYGKGPEIINFFGPPYSAPSFLQVVVEEDERELVAHSQRELGTAIWTHQISGDGMPLALLTDYILPGRNVWIREVEAEGTMSFRILPAPGVRVNPMGQYFKEGDGESLLLTIPKGTTFFTSDSIPYEINLIITLCGGISASIRQDGTISLQIRPGQGRMVFSSDPSYPRVVESSEYTLKRTQAALLEEVRAYWKVFTSRRRDFAALIPRDHPLRERMLEAIDSVSVLIKCQQSVSGGVAAGHYYNMAYVRDQSGVVRGLLALGYISEARAILEFWWNKWSLFGNLYNADGMGNDCARLFFVNDEVEIPAYIILECFQYYKYTQDESFLRHVLPMLDWAYRVQLGHLVEGMTEFSCDETYIAGGTFPKHLMYHGSAESTLLFITGGQQLLDFVDTRKLWDEGRIAEYRKRLNEAADHYKANFMEGGVLYANNPAREKAAGKPRFHFSYCDAHQILDDTLYLTWTERSAQDYYVCPLCRERNVPEVTDRTKRHVLNSVSLVPAYVGSRLFSREELKALVEPVVALFRERGIVPSNAEGSRSLGYDYGLMLYNLVVLDHPAKEEMLRKTLSLLDPTGAWVEYYDQDKPFNCRSRPWESAINIEALVTYIMSAVG